MERVQYLAARPKKLEQHVCVLSLVKEIIAFVLSVKENTHNCGRDKRTVSHTSGGAEHRTSTRSTAEFRNL
jgi:hypothetical protein